MKEKKSTDYHLIIMHYLFATLIVALGFSSLVTSGLLIVKFCHNF